MLKTYLQAAALLAGLSLLFASYVLAYRLGGNASRTAAATAHAAQLAAVVKTLEGQRDAALAESTRRQRIMDAYNDTKDVPDPVVVGLAHRLYVYTTGTGCRAVPGADPVARGTATAAAVAAGAQSAKRISELTQSAFDAAASDAAQMNAMIALARGVSQ